MCMPKSAAIMNDGANFDMVQGGHGTVTSNEAYDGLLLYLMAGDRNIWLVSKSSSRPVCSFRRGGQSGICPGLIPSVLIPSSITTLVEKRIRMQCNTQKQCISHATQNNLSPALASWWVRKMFLAASTDVPWYAIWKEEYCSESVITLAKERGSLNHPTGTE